MNRIDKLFNDRQNGILSIYFCAGCPDANGTADVIRALEQGGVDMVEIGIPFSDPMADGPVIQDAATRALRNGMTLHKLLSQLEGIRNDVKIPLILMGYINPIMQYGFEALCSKCADIGIDGLIIPDLPYDEYMKSYRGTARKYGLEMIMLITPETEDERIRLIDSDSDGGFIYMVSSAATTGAQKDFDNRKREYFSRIKNMNLRRPRMIGFGVSNAATYNAAAEHASGVIIGSRFVTLLNEEKDAGRAIGRLLKDIGQV